MTHATGSRADEAAVREVLATAPVFDGHNDLPMALRTGWGSDIAAAHLDTGNDRLHTDLPSLRAGGVGAQFWSVYVPSDQDPAGAVVQTLEQIDCVHRLVEAFPDDLVLARTAGDVRVAFEEGRIASLLGMEGGHSIDSSLGTLRMMRRLGVAYMTLTHNDNTPWSASATGDPVDFGLTDFGREVVREMNRIGMLVDLSHVHHRTMHDALDVSTRPVIFSHSSCRAVVDHPRNVSDDVLARLAVNGGVQMVTFVPAFVSEACAADAASADQKRAELGLPPRPAPRGPETVSPEEDEGERAFASWRAQNPVIEASVDDVVAHVEHARDVAGIDHIGLGGDFDGIPFGPRGLSRVSDYPNLLGALAQRGWSEGDLAKLTSENITRVLADAEPLPAKS